MSYSSRIAGSCIVLTVALAGCAPWGRCGLRECPADARISAEVRSLLAHSSAFGNATSINVQTVQGVVFLSGLVSTPYLVAEAGSLASQAEGVRKVRNSVVIDNSR